MRVNFTTISKLKSIPKIKYPFNNKPNLKIPKQIIPIISTPIVCYDVYNNNLRKLLDAMEAAGVKVPTYISVNPMSNSGLDEVSKSKFRQSIYTAYDNNEIDESTKNDLLYQVIFTGKGDNELSPRELELAEIDNIDVSLSPDLQEYLINPLKDFGDGLLDNIMDLKDAALESGDKIFSTIKNFIAESADLF